MSFNKCPKVKNRKSITRLTHKMPFSDQKNQKHVLRHKYILLCLLPTMLLADSFKMLNYSENEEDYSLRRF